MFSQEALALIYEAVKEVRMNASVMLLTTDEQVLQKHKEYREKVAKCDVVIEEIEKVLQVL